MGRKNGEYDRVLDKPFIIVEGFDSDNSRNAAWYYSMAPRFFEEATRAGADVLLLDFADARVDMLENAAAVKRAVKYIGGIKTGSTQIRVGGISMGGVIARYALANGSGLDVSHYVSMDAPHRGAAIDQELLDWIRHPPTAVLVFSAFVSGAIVPAQALLNTKAAKQMLVYNPYANGEHDAFMDSTGGAGGPAPTNIGVAFSTGRHPAFGLTRWLKVIPLPLPNPLDSAWNFYMDTGDVIARAGSYLPLSFTDKPGFHRISIADPTFIPHSSAMDGGSFDVELSAHYDRYHNEFPDELTEPILHWLDLKTFPLHNVSIGGDYFLNEGTRGKWNVYNVGGGSGFYRYRWEHWYTCPPGGGARGTRSVRCNEWQSAGAGDDYYEVDSLSTRWNPHMIRVTVTDRYARFLTAVVDTAFVFAEEGYGGGYYGGGGKGKGGLARLDEELEEDSAPILEDNYPNPFNPSTVIRFSLPAAGAVTLKVYDMAGREVATLADRFFEAGSQSVAFDGSSLASGVYYYSIRTKDHTATRTMLLVK